jgi:hypothetical protein
MEATFHYSHLFLCFTNYSHPFLRFATEGRFHLCLEAFEFLHLVMKVSVHFFLVPVGFRSFSQFLNPEWRLASTVSLSQFFFVEPPL